MGTGPKPIKPHPTSACSVTIVGRGRVGTALAVALRAGGVAVSGPHGRGEQPPANAEVVLLCVPDDQIAAAAAASATQAAHERAPGRERPLVGHCSGATGLDALAPHEAFSLHPLMTVIGAPEVDAERLRGSSCAIAGSSGRALATARALALAAGLAPFELDETDRAVYHAAATLASNFLVTLEGAAESLAGRAGVTREQLLPLVQATVANWAAVGARAALTGPIARGDEATVARQRDAIAARAPELTGLFDALCSATRELAGSSLRELAA